MISMGSLSKSPNAVLDFPIDWMAYLKPGEKVVSAACAVTDASLVIGAGAYAPTIDADGKGVVVWLMAGNPGASYVVTCTVTTDNVPPRIEARKFDVIVEALPTGTAQIQIIPPEYSVFAFGARGDGITDDTVPISQAIAAANANPGSVYLGADHLVTSALTPITGHNVVIRGRGYWAQGSRLKCQGASGTNWLQFQGCIASGIEDVFFEGQLVMTSGFGLTFRKNGSSPTFGCWASRVWFDRMGDAINLQSASDTMVEQYKIRSPFGSRGVLLNSDGVTSGNQTTIRIGRCDAPYQFGYPSVAAGLGVKDWATGEAITSGFIRKANGKIWQASVGGTTSGAGSGPSALPSTDTVQARLLDVSDNDVRWRYVSDADLDWIRYESMGGDLTIDDVATINGNRGLVTVNTGGGAPSIVETHDLRVDHPYSYGVLLNDGFDVGIQGWFSSCMAGQNILVAAGFSYDWRIHDSRIFGCALDGILLNKGNGKLSNCNISQNGQNFAVSSDGVQVAAGVTNFDIIGNTSGDDGSGGGACPHRYGINVNAGASDHYVIRGNRVRGNVTAGVNDGGAGANKDVGGNPV